ncbi:MAG TPA: hypothetical protein DEB40_06695 [Elusimicrobia bacterium]|nr:hypothetical protein [Elusimicrobiota bacterium]HBT61416.1 hypothetical protein [Elusimicrobiota bacterium]
MMNIKPDANKAEPRMDAASLFREETFSDRKVGSIRRLTPVKADGSPDSSRGVVYIGEAQLLTSMGALPLTFEIAAASLDDAVRKYGDAVKLAFEEAMQEIQEMRRRASSSLVIPESGAAGLGAGGLMPGALPSGSKLKLP